MSEPLPGAPHSELVFAFVYPIGTSVEPVIETFRNYLRQYGYESYQYRISDQLKSLRLKTSFVDQTPYGKRDALIKAGNEARAIAQDDKILAVMSVEDIATRRRSDEKERPAAMPRTAHLVRSLKRPEEVSLLRAIYKSGFYLIGIANDDDAQEGYLINELGIQPKLAKDLIERDQNEDLDHGQRTRDTFYLSDVFIQANEEQYKEQISRFLELVFGHPFITPQRHEHSMFLAYASAARSAQLGRQVGAAIATPEGEILAVGMNEVPSPKGGLYWDGDEEDHRDHNKSIDPNAGQRELIAESIIEKLTNEVVSAQKLREFVDNLLRKLKIEIPPLDLERLIQEELSENGVLIDGEKAMAAVKKSKLRSITEYGRAVHGEMDAILTCARLGISVRGNYLYVTTFPCHNCTRHIIASGIRRVYYVEPYPKSKARDLHSDAICFDEEEAKATGKIPFLPFIGVGPRRYLDFFSMDLSGGREVKRKEEDGKPCNPQKIERTPRVYLDPDSYLESEERLRRDFDSVLRVLQPKQAPQQAENEGVGSRPS
ncbi:MAG: anti-phage dCTP deaminase [Terracidiphilus sp.]